MELFSIHRESSSKDKLVPNSPLLTPLLMTGNGGGGGGGLAGVAGSSAAGGGLTGTSGTRFDAGLLGEKLLSAARDIGTTAGTGGQSTEKATMNENLRNFGKFFRRDIGGLGVRFGKGGGEDGQR